MRGNCNRNILALLAFVAVAVSPLCSQKTNQNPKADAQDGSQLSTKSRIYLFRGLTAESAVVRKTLPRGRQGIHLKDNGQIDEHNYEILLANLGPAAKPGETIQITRVEFKKDSIIFELNGSQKGHWYDHVQVSGPVAGGVTQTTDQPEVVVYPSVITLDFGRPVPDLSVEEVKAMLAPVLDFNLRAATLVTTESWPPEVQEAIRNHAITAGMTKDQVVASRGRPDNKIREKKGSTEQETWVYGTAPAKILLITFEGDEVVEAHEFIPGIPATKVPREGDAPKSDAQPGPPKSDPPHSNP